MSLKLFTAPAAEPVTLAEAKMHLRVTQDSEDALIQTLIIAARTRAEDITRRRFITQTWDLFLENFPAWGSVCCGDYWYHRTAWWLQSAGMIEMPNAPLQSVTSITYIDVAGATQTLDPTKYAVDAKAEPGRVAPAYNESWPATRVLNAVTIRFICGYGLVAAVPAAIKAAMLLMIGHLFEHRQDVSDFQAFPMPRASEDLLAPYRVLRF